MSPEEEASLVRRLKRRDERAFRAMVKTFERQVFNVVYRMLGDRHEAEDLSQEVFVSVFRNIDSFRGESKLSTWIFRVSTNHCKNRLKYLQRRGRDKTQDIDDTQQSEFKPGAGETRFARPDRQMEGRELEQIVQRALKDLNEEHRTLIVLRDLESMPYEEIASITGLRVGTVKSRLFRARAALKKAIGRYYESA